jgi:hypothetical protein
VLTALCVTLAALPVRAQPVESPTEPAVAGSEGGGEESLDIGVTAALERARSYYQAGAYDSCETSYDELFADLESPSEDLPVEALEQARVHYAACLLALGKARQADEQLRAAMRENPLMASPDPVVFPAQVRDLFFKVKADFLEEIRKAQEEQLRLAREEERAREQRALQERLRVEGLERLAAQEVVVHKNHRWIAALPFGVGQFQNGDSALGAVFLVTELALVGATIGAVSRQLSLHSQAGGGGNVIQASAFNDPIRLSHNVELISGAGFLLMAGLGILEAQLNFEEELHLGARPRREPLPPRRRRGRVEPRVSVGSAGATLGVGGRF